MGLKFSIPGLFREFFCVGKFGNYFNFWLLDLLGILGVFKII